MPLKGLIAHVSYSMLFQMGSNPTSTLAYEHPLRGPSREKVTICRLDRWTQGLSAWRQPLNHIG